VLAVGGAAIGATYTSLFRAEHLEVIGARRVDADEVLAAAGLGPRTNVLHLDRDLAVRGVLELPWVATARIDRELPGTLIVTIRERTPVATIDAGGATLLVTRDGAVLVGEAGGRLPAVRALSGAADPDAIAGAARALSAMPTRLVRHVAEVVLVPGGTLLVRMRSGLPVEWGSATEASEKAAALDAILGWIRDEDARVSAIDVSVPQAPRATPGTPPAATG
jgi:cell division protein FtsQ